jgi:ribosomal protein S18 acetylase RimI-like enzyme
MVMSASVAALDRAGLAAWPALEQIDDGGWVCRFAEGFTRRANAINILDPADGEDVEARLARLSGLYRQRQIEPVFRLTQLVAPSVVDGLRAAGWRPDEKVAVMAMPLAGLGLETGAAVRHIPAIDPDWQADHARLNVYSARQAATLARMIALMPVQATGFAIGPAGAATGTAMAVSAGEIAYVFGVAVDKAARGRGGGWALMLAALTWAASSGARHCALQVLPENHTARRLYHRLGFADHHDYQYWIAP